MHQLTNTNPPDKIQFAAFVALDWADQEHAWALQVPGSEKREHGKLAQTPEAIEEWAATLAARFEGRPIAVGLEQARGALIYALAKYEHLVLFPIHPNTSSNYRAAMFPSGAKDDPKDTELLLELLLWHREHLRPLSLDTVPTRQVQVLVERRRQLVGNKTAFTNRITDQLKQYFPQMLTWFDEIDSPLVAAFLERWPTLPSLQAAQPEEILKFLHLHNSRSAARNGQRLEQIRQARPLTLDPAIVEPAVLVVETLLQVVQALRAGIAKLDQAIAKLCAEHPDYAIFQSFPGAGDVLAPRLLAAFGSQRDRFSGAGEVQTYSGIAPVVSRSGKSMWVHFRWACPKFLRQSFHEYAASSIQFCDWARDFYDKQRAKGKGHHAAVRSLAFKWIRILYRCWCDRTPYCEQRHLAALAARGSTPAEQPGWKNVAGFWKFSGPTP
jgi:transposase